MKYLWNYELSGVLEADSEEEAEKKAFEILKRMEIEKDNISVRPETW